MRRPSKKAVIEGEEGEQFWEGGGKRGAPNHKEDERKTKKKESNTVA